MMHGQKSIKLPQEVLRHGVTEVVFPTHTLSSDTFYYQQTTVPVRAIC